MSEMIIPFDPDDGSLETAKNRVAWLENRLSDPALASQWRMRYRIALRATQAYVQSLEGMDGFVFDAGELPVEQWVEHIEASVEEMKFLVKDVDEAVIRGEITDEQATEVREQMAENFKQFREILDKLQEIIEEAMDDDEGDENGS